MQISLYRKLSNIAIAAKVLSLLYDRDGAIGEDFVPAHKILTRCLEQVMAIFRLHVVSPRASTPFLIGSLYSITESRHLTDFFQILESREKQDTLARAFMAGVKADVTDDYRERSKFSDRLQLLEEAHPELEAEILLPHPRPETIHLLDNANIVHDLWSVHQNTLRIKLKQGLVDQVQIATDNDMDRRTIIQHIDTCMQVLADCDLPVQCAYYRIDDADWFTLALLRARLSLCFLLSRFELSKELLMRVVECHPKDDFINLMDKFYKLEEHLYDPAVEGFVRGLCLNLEREIKDHKAFTALCFGNLPAGIKPFRLYYE